MDNVQCTGGEAQITHCPSTPIGEHDCHHRKMLVFAAIVEHCKFNKIIAM